jgi:hypothetical protein
MAQSVLTADAGPIVYVSRELELCPRGRNATEPSRRAIGETLS